MKHSLRLNLNFIVVVLVQLLLFSTVNNVQSQETDLLSIAPSINGLYEGETAVFNCTSYNYTTLQWTLNNEPLYLFRDLGETIHTESVKTNNDTNNAQLVSMLTIPARLMHNGSTVSCHGVVLFTKSNTNNQWLESMFLVQGVPDKVENFQGMQVSDTRLMFSWTPPSHILGIEPCCNNYSINITNIDSGDNVFSSHITTDTFIEFDTVSTPNHICSLYQIQISAFNNVGEGEVMDTIWSLGGFFEANQATEELFYSKDNNGGDTSELMLGVSVTIEGLCLNMLDNMTLLVECDSVSQSLQRTNDIQASSSQRELQRYIEIMIPDTHKDRTCTYDVALENRVDLSKRTFSTHDTQSVSLTNDPGMMCISCSYIRDSPGRGCVLTAVQIGINTGIEYSTNIPLTDDNGCLVNLTQGRYNIRVYDWQLNGGRSEETVFTSVIDAIPLPSPDPTNPPRSSSNTGGAIAGGVVGGVIVVGLVIALIVIAVVFMLVRRSRSNINRTQSDCVTSGTIQLNSGEPVYGHDRLKDILEKQKFEHWDYNGRVKIEANKKDGYRYVLITQDLKE